MNESGIKEVTDIRRRIAGTTVNEYNMVMEGNCGEHILTHGLDSSVHGAAATMMSSAGVSPVERKTNKGL